ncbi:hypothetical protein SAMN05216302_100418 [Nitrosomonas aestuarii]|uniref:Uncharacterized protein n=1 Tax=Nitrosomonas aestuarii TaxID=52441 RepID=A0A1I3YIZ7_9PROT|nr:hypothetical protein [Nitrosomonas aestuarii]SFK31802.1 hypothetical protein SAMN05216302_100418 [Nitrosomonas aestuarii]
MKTSRYLTISSALVLLVASLSMNTWATEAGYGAQNNVSTHNHFALAEQYENLAKEMQAKATEQMEILEHKPRSSFFGKNGQHIKSHIAYKISTFEQAAQDNLEKAAYHKAVAAAQTSPELTDRPAEINKQLNKAKYKANQHSGL